MPHGDLDRNLPRSEPHFVVGWGLTAWLVLERYLPLRAAPAHFQLVTAMTEATISVSVTELLRDIELTLKQHLERQLRRITRSTWWDLLPQHVKTSATARHKWASAQLGYRRVCRPRNVAWLSMGDVLKALATLTPPDWQACLRAETRKIRAFDQAIRPIKAFRDNSLAHPKPRRISNPELATLCRAIRRLPLVLRPREWSAVIQLLERIKTLPEDDKRQLSTDAALSRSQPSSVLLHWAASPIFDFLPTPRSPTHRQVTWRVRILKLCGDLDCTGTVFFGKTDN